MWFDAAFGIAGLTTVGYRQYKSDGSDAVARTTANVVEIGGGAYGCDITLDDAAVGIEWDTGEATPIYAHESVVMTRMVYELWKWEGLESGNAMTVTPASRAVSDGTMSATLTGDGITTKTVSRA